jgi:hypothetical protein
VNLLLWLAHDVAPSMAFDKAGQGFRTIAQQGWTGFACQKEYFENRNKSALRTDYGLKFVAEQLCADFAAAIGVAVAEINWRFANPNFAVALPLLIFTLIHSNLRIQ